MKTVITDIEIEKEKLEELRAILKTNASKSIKNSLIKKYAGGYCFGCNEIPTKLVSYDISDSEISAKRLERYCDKCFVKLTATNGIDETLAVKGLKSI